jgi:predicted nucleic acid-binding protein
VRLPAKGEKECLSLKSAKAPLRLRVRADIAFTVGSPGIEIIEVTVHLDALSRCKGTKAHFVDCLIAATAVAKNLPVSTFDQDFRKFGDVRVEPE